MPLPKKGSKAKELSKADLVAIGKGAAIAGIGAVLYFVTDIALGLDYGPHTPVVISLLTVGVNALRKYLLPQE